MRYNSLYGKLQETCLDRGMVFEADAQHYPFSVTVSAATEADGQTSIEGMDPQKRGDGSLTFIVWEGNVALRIEGSFFITDADLQKIKKTVRKMGEALMEELAMQRLGRKTAG